MKFYLASSYRYRHQARKTAQMLEEITGGKCTSSWLRPGIETLPAKFCARVDLHDIRNSNLLVYLQQTGATFGKCFEAGFAHAMKLPVIVVNSGPITDSVFFGLDGVYVVADVDSAGKLAIELGRMYGWRTERLTRSSRGIKISAELRPKN